MAAAEPVRPVRYGAHNDATAADNENRLPGHSIFGLAEVRGPSAPARFPAATCLARACEVSAHEQRRARLPCSDCVFASGTEPSDAVDADGGRRRPTANPD